MKLISRYIIKELMGPFLFGLAVIMFIFVIKFLLQYISKIFGKGLEYSVIFKFIYLNLAWMLALAVPMAVLIAVLMAFGRLSADNEITVFKSSGINLYRVMFPALVWGIALTIAMIWYNDRVLPEFNHQARLLSRSISQKKPALELEEGIYLKLNKYNILVEEIEKPQDNKSIFEKNNILAPEYREAGADKLKNVTIFDFNDSQNQQTIIADYGYLMVDKNRKLMVFTLYDGEYHIVDTRDYSEYQRGAFIKNTFNIPAKGLVLEEITEGRRGDREMTIAMMQAEIEKYKKNVLKERQRMSLEAGKFLISADIINKRLAYQSNDKVFEAGKAMRRKALTRVNRKTNSLWLRVNSSINQLKYFGKQINKYQVEIHKKYSIAFACFIFIFIGAPLGIRAKKGSLGVGASFSIGFFLLYWVCLIGGEDLADKQIIYPWAAMWFPNILVGTIGFYLTYRTIKETTFIQWERLFKRTKELTGMS